MKNPGRMKTRLVIEAPLDSDDGQGGVVRSHVPVAAAWAAVMPGSMQHGGEADSDGAVVRLRIVLRSGHGLTLRHRLVDGDRIYRIDALGDSADRRFTEIHASYRVT
ncbi:head-tail adaptor protein [Rhodopseudomonas boonkerdii]|uniref:phage head completion protein n=1 Tax=Rhodopseudomonas boonkerdii TaxID=475937 RepID=UPI001E2C2D62|nr:head-tail adaptor protein [Rhodopseudomonas boonkerdii]UGV26096.1 head-tail adaptor protein [Rhodopseudomonas boonkerdii]